MRLGAGPVSVGVPTPPPAKSHPAPMRFKGDGMPKSGLCEIVVLLDRSGSMAACRQDTEGGFNSFVAEQKKAPGECVMTLVQFDDGGIDAVHEAKPIAGVPPLKLEPRGNTPLLDAMGTTIRKTGERLAATAEANRPERVLFVVITDGQENASHEFSKEAVRRMVEEQTNKWKWEFAYIGANVDAFGEAGRLGIPLQNSSGYAQTPVAVAAVYANLSSNVLRARGDKKAHLSYSDRQRAAQGHVSTVASTRP